eukprot:2973232-Pyramimonas_sp.AAC.1
MNASSSRPALVSNHRSTQSRSHRVPYGSQLGRALRFTASALSTGIDMVAICLFSSASAGGPPHARALC